MELDLIEYKNENFGANDCFKLEYHNQDVKNKPEFKKWYKNVKEKIYKENLKRGKDFIHNDYRILTIGFCMKCTSYTICPIIDNSFCYAKCNICKQTFCIGCLKDLNRSCKEPPNASICLKGYLKTLYLRIIYRRAGFETTKLCFQIMHIFFVFL